MGKWYQTGYDGIAAEKDRLARLGGPNRFWMAKGETREVVMIDDDPFTIFEHNWRANGTWRNWCTCVRDVHETVPCCDKLGDRSRAFTGFYTIVDCTDRKDSKGNSYQFEVKLLPAKLKTLELIRRKKHDKTSLVGAKFKVVRDTDDDPNVGNDWEFQQTVDLEKLFKVATYRGKKLVDLYKEAANLESDAAKRLTYAFQLGTAEENGKKVILPRINPFNYEELLAPKDPRELKQMLGSVVADGGSSGKDDEIPF